MAWRHGRTDARRMDHGTMDHGTMGHGPWSHGPWTMDRGTLGRGPGYIFTKHGSTVAGGVAAVLGGI